MLTKRISHLLSSKFPLIQHRNIAVFYLLTAVNAAWFVAGNWIFFWTRFMNYGQLGWVDAIAFSFGLLAEIPTGAFADLVGKKRTIQLAMLSACLGVLIISSANSLTQILLGFLAAQLGWALYSGAAEALAYDSLVDLKQQTKFDSVISSSHSLDIIITALTTLVGTGLYAIHWRLPHYMWAVAYLLGLIAAFKLTEPRTDSQTFSLSKYFRQLIDGSRHLFIPQLRQYIPAIFAAQSGYIVYSFGFLHPAIAISFGFMDRAQSIIYAGSGLVSAYIVKSFPQIRRRISDFKGVVFLASLIGLGYFLAGFPLSYWGLIAMLCITLAGKLVTPWASVIINRQLYSHYRATALSTLALFVRIPYAVIAIFAGRLIESGQLYLFNFGAASIIITVTITSLGIHLIHKYRTKR
jgi:MFS family permease